MANKLNTEYFPAHKIIFIDEVGLVRSDDISRSFHTITFDIRIEQHYTI